MHGNYLSMLAQTNKGLLNVQVLYLDVEFTQHRLGNALSCHSTYLEVPNYVPPLPPTPKIVDRGQLGCDRPLSPGRKIRLCQRAGFLYEIETFCLEQSESQDVRMNVCTSRQA